jgi:hypothetical protein
MAEKLHDKNKVNFRAKRCMLHVCSGCRKLKKTFILLTLK